jgi:phosphatidate cytidylyltransferase
MARDDERDEGLEHTGYRSGRVRIVGAEPAGRSAGAPDEDDGLDADDQALPSTLVPPLPHWTEPATGEVPAILGRGLERTESDPFAVSGPTWREEGSDWEAQDDEFDPSMLVGDKTGQGALDAGPSDRQPWVFDLPGSKPPAGGIFSDDESEWGEDGDAEWDELALATKAPSWVGDEDEDTAVTPVVKSDDAPGEVSDPLAATLSPPVRREIDEPEGEDEPRRSARFEDPIALDDLDDTLGEPKARFPRLRAQQERRAAATERKPAPPLRRAPIADRLQPPSAPTRDEAPPRNIGAAIISGLVLGAVALITFKIGPVASVALVTVIVTMAAAEAYAAFRQGGYHPVTLLGLVATVSLMVATYNKGEAALPLVLVLLLVFCFIWHLAGVEQTDAVRSTGTTLFVFGWVAIFGSYGALLLSPALFPDRHGIAFLLGGVIACVAYDVGALTFGAWLGRHPMASVSPNKTWEGFVGGLVTSVVLTAGIVHLIHPWTVGKAAALGVVVSIVSTLGDLFESTVKRHLGRKDIGRLLPGHGGILDRVDGLLFVLPATFYLVIAFHLG